MASSTRHAHADRPQCGELHGVAEEVEEHLADPAGIALDHLRHVGRGKATELEALLAGRLGDEVERVLEDRADVEVHRLERQLAGLDLREVEDVVDDRQQVLGRAADGVGELALLVAERRVEQQVGHADDAVHRRADLVAHRREEAALGGGRGQGRVARLGEFDGLLLELGEVAGTVGFGDGLDGVVLDEGPDHRHALGVTHQRAGQQHRQLAALPHPQARPVRAVGAALLEFLGLAIDERGIGEQVARRHHRDLVRGVPEHPQQGRIDVFNLRRPTREHQAERRGRGTTRGTGLPTPSADRGPSRGHGRRPGARRCSWSAPRRAGG